MATSTYVYNLNESLTSIAARFNTNIITLVKYNSWLKDPYDGHTFMFPYNSSIKRNVDLSTTVEDQSTGESYVSILPSFILKSAPKLDSIKLYAKINFEYNNETYDLNLDYIFDASSVPNYKLDNINNLVYSEYYFKCLNYEEAIDNLKDDDVIKIIEDNILPSPGNLFYYSKLNIFELYYRNIQVKQLKFKQKNVDIELISFKVDFDYEPVDKSDFLVIPIVGNGNLAIEDYWNNLDKNLGLPYKSIIENYIDKVLNYEIYDEVTREAILAVESTLDNSPNNYDVSNISNYISSYILDYLGNIDNIQFNDTDYTSLNISTIIQSVIKNIPKNNNLSIYKLSKAKQNNSSQYTFSPLSRINDIDYSSTPVRQPKTPGNIANGKCIIRVGNNEPLEMPCFPDSISDSVSVNYNSQDILGRSEPYQMYVNTQARSINFVFKLHREMTGNELQIENIINTLQSAAYPQYEDSNIAAQKVSVKVGDQVYIEGILENYSCNYSGSIDFNNNSNGKYNVIDLSFSITEVTGNPKSARDIRKMGSFRIN